MAIPETRQWQLPAAMGPHTLPRDVPLPMAQVLLRRGIDSAEKLRLFLEPPHRLPYDPLRLLGMDRALGRLYQAVNRKEVVGVFGDFDVDGVTGAAIIAEGLVPLGVRVVPYLPHRTSEGHGLSQAAVEHLVDRGARLIVTVDCGVTSVAEVARARQLGADVIITDHHVPQAAMPDAVAVINPKIPGGSYPFGDLCGAGLAFKLVQGLFQLHGQPVSPSLLELAALGTIADLVPLLDENRFLVQEGLRALSRTERPGLQALYRRAGVDPEGLTAESVAFQVSPRLNAPGRLGHAMDSFRLLTTDSREEAEALADRLEELNRARRLLSEEALATALAQVRSWPGDTLPPIVVVEDQGIAPGVAGLVAGRLTELLHRPAVVLSGDGDQLVASGRSIPAFNLFEALAAGQHLLVRYGGHAQAAGFTIRRENLPLLAEHLTAYARRVLPDAAPRPSLAIDAEISLAQLTDDLLQGLSTLAPFGPGNLPPVFLTRRAPVLDVRYMGGAGQHIALKLGGGDREWTALAFNQGDRWAPNTTEVDLVYSITSDHWRGPGAAALRVLDFRPASS